MAGEYGLLRPGRGAAAILQEAKRATHSDTAPRQASEIPPKGFEIKLLSIASRGIRSKVVVTADNPAPAGTTNVSAIPKQYSNGRPEVDDRA